MRIWSAVKQFSTTYLFAFTNREHSPLTRLTMMAATTNPEMDNNLQVRTFLKDLYSKTAPRNVFSMFVTGGGVTALEWVFTVPGASNSLMDGGVVYARSSLTQFMIENSNHRPGDDGDEDTFCAVTSSTSVRMADSAWSHAAQLFLADTRDFSELKNVHLFGISCTAALVSGQPKKGSHRVHIATTSQSGTYAYSLKLEKGARTREEEDIACSRLILDAIAQSCGLDALPVDYLLSIPAANNNETTHNNDTSTIATSGTTEILNHAPLSPTEVVEIDEIHRGDVIDRMYIQKVKQAIFVKKSKDTSVSSSSSSSPTPTKDDQQNNVFGTIPSDPENDDNRALMNDFVVLEDVKIPNDCLVFPGSFNPLHEGHVGLVVAALEKLNRENGSQRTNSNNKAIPVIFEIAMINADKPPLPKAEILRRIQQFDPYTNPVLKAAGLTNIAVAITTEPLFLGKTKLFRSSTFLIGSDTLIRLINPKYYGPPLPVVTGPTTTSSQPMPVTPGTTPTGSPMRFVVKDGSTTTLPQSEEQRLLLEQKIYATVAMLNIIAERGCRFIVGGRALAPGSFANTPAGGKMAAAAAAAALSVVDQVNVADGNVGSGVSSERSEGSSAAFDTMQSVLRNAPFPLPLELEQLLFIGLSEDEFRVDISSSQIRSRRNSEA